MKSENNNKSAGQSAAKGSRPAQSSKKTGSTSARTGNKQAAGTIEQSKLMKLFEDELKDVYWVEKALVKALPKMMKNASHPDLVAAIEQHLAETQEQVEKVEQIFEIIGKKPSAKKCEAMQGILDESTEMMKEADKGAMRDAAIIAGGQKVEHYEIASYGTLRAFAEVLQLDDAVEVLEEILEQEKNADETLTEIAVMAVNLEAAQESEEEEEGEEE